MSRGIKKPPALLTAIATTGLVVTTPEEPLSVAALKLSFPRLPDHGWGRAGDGRVCQFHRRGHLRG